MFMKQVLFLIILAEDKKYTDVLSLLKVLVHLQLVLHTDDLGVSTTFCEHC